MQAIREAKREKSEFRGLREEIERAGRTWYIFRVLVSMPQEPLSLVADKVSQEPPTGL
jgi:hypothetical protein